MLTTKSRGTLPLSWYLHNKYENGWFFRALLLKWFLKVFLYIRCLIKLFKPIVQRFLKQNSKINFRSEPVLERKGSLLYRSPSHIRVSIFNKMKIGTKNWKCGGAVEANPTAETAVPGLMSTFCRRSTRNWIIFRSDTRHIM